MKWAVGVLTVPERRERELPCTLASLRAGGFDAPHLFVDGAETPDYWRALGCADVSCRWPRLGVTGNWILSAWELYLRHPGSDRYFLAQDDLLACRNLRQYLERCPLPPRGYYNLYTMSTANERIVEGQPPGWYEGALLNPEPQNPRRLQCGRGALALLFTREGLKTLLTSGPLFDKPNAADPVVAKKRIDGGVVNAMNLAGWREMIHSPSLVQHTGAKSTIGNDCDRVYGRAKTFMGEEFDALTLLE